MMVFIAMIQSCATVVAPEGGAIDETPPQMDSLRSTPNFQTNFTKQRIELKFDEWLTLNDVFSQVVISPPMDPSEYEVTLKGKTVRFDFKEEAVLRENATYTINFGEAIQDLNNQNKTSNLKFVFATGDVIDSLEVKGVIRDAYTGEAVEDALFMLYDNLEDSVVRTERPLYFARTNSLGQFNITNVRADTFKGFALVDSDVNYLYNQPTEKIGFIDSLIVINDTTDTNIKVKMFTEILPLKVRERFVADYGKVSFHFNKTPKDLELTYSQVDQKVYQRMEGDSIQLWYDMDSIRSWKIFLQQDTFLNDTIRVRTKSKSKFFEENPFQIVSERGAEGRKISKKDRKKDEDEPTLKTVLGIKNVNPTLPFELNFNYPLENIDLSKIKILEDTSKTEVKSTIAIDSTDKRNLFFDFEWKEKMNYQIDLLPGALTDFYGNQNDTLEQPILIQEKKEFGNLILLVKPLRKDTNYIVEVLNPDGSILKSFIFEQQTEAKEELKFLPVGEYSIRLIEDLNKNGKWDPGNYDLKKQPERIYSKTIEELRANWDVEVQIRETDLDLEKSSPILTQKEENDQKKEIERGAKTTGKRRGQ